MAKLYLDYNALNSLLYDLDTILKKINKIVYESDYLSIPYEFKYSQYLKRIYENNQNTYNKLMKKKNEIENIYNGFKNVEKQNILNTQSIDCINTRYRSKIIN